MLYGIRSVSISSKHFPRNAMHSAAYAAMRFPPRRPSVCHVRMLYQND